jgi:integrase
MHDVQQGKTAATIKDDRGKIIALVRGGRGTASRTVGLLGSIMTYAAVDLLATIPRHDGSGLVIASGTKGGRYGGLRHAWDRIAKRAGLKGMTPHSLRHSFATTANTLGCSEATIAAMLGHSRGTVTSRYVHLIDDALLAAADRFSGAIARAMSGAKPATVVGRTEARRSR